MTSGCGAPPQGGTGEGIHVAGETVIAGKVSWDGRGVGGAHVRLLDATGEFTGEVVASAEGEFRFFARAGTWTVQALSPHGRGEVTVAAPAGEVTTTEVTVSP